MKDIFDCGGDKDFDFDFDVDKAENVVGHELNLLLSKLILLLGDGLFR